MQGVIKSYDPASRMGVVVRDTDLAEYDLAADALDGSVFRMLRQGQRVVFDLERRSAWPRGCASAPRSTWARPGSRAPIRATPSTPRAEPDPPPGGEWTATPGG